MSDVLALRYLLVPLFIIVIGYGANCYVTGRIINRTWFDNENSFVSQMVRTVVYASEL